MDKPSFSPQFWLELAINNPLGRTDITEQDARDWFDLVWPAYRLHGRVRVNYRHKLRIARWWLRLTAAELDLARARAVNLLRSKANDRFEKRLDAAPPPQPPRTDLPPLRVSGGPAHG